VRRLLNPRQPAGSDSYKMGNFLPVIIHINTSQPSLNYHQSQY
jgi:hypothetical protein